MRRSHESQIVEGNRAQSIRQALWAIKEQYRAMNALEADAIRSMKTRVEKHASTIGCYMHMQNNDLLPFPNFRHVGSVLLGGGM